MLTPQESPDQLSVLLEQIEPDVIRFMHRVQKPCVPLGCDDVGHFVDSVHQHHDRFRRDLMEKVGSRDVQLLSHHSAFAIQYVSLESPSILVIASLALVGVS